jgi:ribonuclease HI
LKGQALANFIAGFTSGMKEEHGEADLWIIDVDGSVNKRNSGAGVVVKPPEGQKLRYAIRMRFKATNNEAEYEAVLAGLAIVIELGAQNVEIRSHSNMIVEQVNGEYEAKEERIQKYLAKVRELMAKLKQLVIKKVP